MTDGQWAPLLPAAGSTGGRGGRPETGDRRLVLDANFSLVRGGIAWPALPADFVRDARKSWDLAVAIVKRPDQAKGFVLLHRR